MNSTFAIYLLLSIIAGASVVMMLYYRKKYRQNVEKLEQQRLNNKISSLKNQMSPHFILNTINNISTLIEDEPDRAHDLLIEFGDLMRYSTYDVENNKLELEKALAYLENYINLQRLRFSNDKAVELNIQGSPKAKYIAPMMLLPFIENAFKYGTNKRGPTNEPAIQINIKIADSSLHLLVKNKIPDNQKKPHKRKGIGIENTRKRLNLIYPNKHRLDIYTQKGYFFVDLTINELKNENHQVHSR